MSEPFLAALVCKHNIDSCMFCYVMSSKEILVCHIHIQPRYDAEEPPVTGFDDCEAMHTWHMRCLLDSWIQTNFNSVLFADDIWVQAFCRLLKAAQDGGAYR